MTSYKETFVPTSWERTTLIAPSNPTRSSWPEVENVEQNIFNLSIVTENKIDDDLVDCNERLVLFFVHDNNEMYLTEETTLTPRQLVDDKPKNANTSGSIREKTYMLKVVDNDTKSIMYYDVKLARVEMLKLSEEPATEETSISEDLEVIAVYDEDEENPFDTEFEDPSK